MDFLQLEVCAAWVSYSSRPVLCGFPAAQGLCCVGFLQPEDCAERVSYSWRSVHIFPLAEDTLPLLREENLIRKLNFKLGFYFDYDK